MREPTTYCDWKDDIFLEAYTEANGCSMLSGIPISNPTPTSFAHILAKGRNKYYKFMYYLKNIYLLTDFEHHIYDNGTEEQRQEYSNECKSQGIECNWQKLYKLRDELKQEYRKIFS